MPEKKDAAMEKLDRLEDRQQINEEAYRQVNHEDLQWLKDCKDMLRRYARPEMMEMEKELQKRDLTGSFKYNEDVPIYTLQFAEASIGQCELEVKVDRTPEYRLQLQGRRDDLVTQTRYMMDVSSNGEELKDALWSIFNGLLSRSPL